MLMPSIFNDSFFNDDFFDFPKSLESRYGRSAKEVMKTDVLEDENGYECLVDLPGFTKDDVKISLEDGVMTIEAAKESKNDEDAKNFIRRERYFGKFSRSYYVGEGLNVEDIKAKFENGVLDLYVPKVDASKVETKKYIAIE